MVGKSINGVAIFTLVGGQGGFAGGMFVAS